MSNANPARPCNTVSYKDLQKAAKAILKGGHGHYLVMNGIPTPTGQRLYDFQVREVNGQPTGHQRLKRRHVPK